MPLQTQGTSLSDPVMPTTLGKRRRANNPSGVVEEGKEAEYVDTELASSVVGLDRKRPRTDIDNTGSSHAPSGLEDIQQSGEAFLFFLAKKEPAAHVNVQCWLL